MGFGQFSELQPIPTSESIGMNAEFGFQIYIQSTYYLEALLVHKLTEYKFGIPKFRFPILILNSEEILKIKT